MTDKEALQDFIGHVSGRELRVAVTHLVKAASEQQLTCFFRGRGRAILLGLACLQTREFRLEVLEVRIIALAFRFYCFVLRQFTPNLTPKHECSVSEFPLAWRHPIKLTP